MSLQQSALYAYSGSVGRVVTFLVARTGCSSAWRLVHVIVRDRLTQVVVVLLVHVICIVRIKLFSEVAFR